MRKLFSLLFPPADRQSPHPYRWEAVWFVVMLIASVWSFAVHEMWLGYAALLFAGLDLAGLAVTFRLRYWQRRLQQAEAENERLRRELR